jgi:hypothetical protein
MDRYQNAEVRFEELRREYCGDDGVIKGDQIRIGRGGFSFMLNLI